MSLDTPTSRPPLSVLDLSVLSEGQTTGDALRNTTAFAQRADALGFTRFWVAEHHNIPTIASTSPPVLMAHLAAVTERIHLGSGGVMLPNHASLVVAEQFAMLEALHPGRIDLGIGRAPGTDLATAAALRRSADALDAEDFPRHLLDLMGLLGDPRTDEGLWSRFRATPAPAEKATPWFVLLGSSDYSAQLAGMLGLPYAFAHHFGAGPRSATTRAFSIYRERFVPSHILDEPYAIVPSNVLTAATDEEARWFAGPGSMMSLIRRTGRFLPLMSPAQAAANRDLPEAESLSTHRIVGDPASVVEQLEGLVADTQADEVMISTTSYGIEERLRSLELLAEAWGLRDGG